MAQQTALPKGKQPDREPPRPGALTRSVRAAEGRGTKRSYT
jgi:hypothetical protein